MEYISNDEFYALLEQQYYYTLIQHKLLTESQLEIILEYIKDNPIYYWEKISRYQVLSESFMEKYQDKINWYYVSKYQTLSESFIEKFKDKLEWYFVSVYQNLSESIFDKLQDKVDWDVISYFQNLSESFIEKYQDKVDWSSISRKQKLSESFIEKYQDKVDWFHIFKHQKLSESFIEKHKDKTLWKIILKYQTLSEAFIENNLNSFKYESSYIKLIAHYQEYSISFARKHNLPRSYVTYKKRYCHNKINKIIKSGKYECNNDYFIAYKAVRPDRYSLYNFQYQYLPGETYESRCDCTDEEDSFGLNVGTYKFAESYLGCNKGIIVKCKINFNDVGRVVHDDEKIRCFKITIID